MHEKINVRFATESDIKNVFELSNDDFVRKNSFNKEKIQWEHHVDWFMKRIKNSSEPFYIIEDENNNFVGQVRIDNLKKDTMKKMNKKRLKL